MSEVLVTGGAGFVGSHIVLQLIAAGHQARITVRNLDRESETRELFAKDPSYSAQNVTFVVADLLKDEGWPEAVAGCDYVLHVASPFPAGVPKHEDELIVPAREGTLRVLRAARDAGVRRVVVTSSFGAIGYGHAPRKKPFDESDWTDTRAKGLSAYIKSKAMAERAAWDFIAKEGNGLELSVINPVGIFGPVLGKNLSGSTLIIKNMLTGAMSTCPQLYFGVVDVRDVADLHLRAMTHPAAKNQRFLAVAGECISMFQAASILRRKFDVAAEKAPKKEIPNWLIRFSAIWNPAARRVLPDIGKKRNSTSEKARQILEWNPRSTEVAIAATAESLIRLHLLK
jgi:nucleoside-diphosphate-sugar epimerase